MNKPHVSHHSVYAGFLTVFMLKCVAYGGKVHSKCILPEVFRTPLHIKTIKIKNGALLNTDVNF